METTIRVIQFDAFPTGTYQPLYSRPYVAEIHGHALDDLANRIERVTRTNPTTRIDGSLISSLSQSIIQPSASWESQLEIPYGWNQTRYRFTLTVMVSTHLGSEVYYFNGYTEYFDPSYGGNIDPHMRFFINSYIRVSRINDPYSPEGYRDQITDSAQVINGRLQSGTSPVLFGMRPEDVLTGIQSSYLSQTYSHLRDNEFSDFRINKAHENIRSRRSNGTPAAYLAHVIDGYRSASMLADFGQGTEDIYSRAIQHSHEPAPSENPFIRALGNVTGQPGITNFTTSQLELIDPDCVLNVHEVGEAIRLTHQDDFAPWSGTDNITHMANRIRSSVAGLLTDCMLKSAVLSCDSHTVSGQPDIKVHYGEGVSAAVDKNYFMNLQHRFATEVLPDLTANGRTQVSFFAEIDLWGDSVVNVSVDGSPQEPFCIPSWCDSMIAPISTVREDNFNGMINGIETVINHSLDVAKHSGAVINNAI